MYLFYSVGRQDVGFAVEKTLPTLLQRTGDTVSPISVFHLPISNIIENLIKFVMFLIYRLSESGRQHMTLY